MRTRQLLAAATHVRSLMILAAGIVTAAALSNPFPAVIGLGLYLWAVQKLADSPRFQAEAERIKTARAMAERYGALEAAAQAVQRQLLYGRTHEVIASAREIYQGWLNRPAEQEAKSRIVDEALRLAELYMKILQAYHAIYTGNRPLDLADVRDRLVRNKQRLEGSLDLEARRLLTQTIEMDERVLRQMDEHAVERERYEAKLAAIEAALDMLQRQLYDPAVPDDFGRLHEMLLEAEAMDHAMEEVQQQVRVRERA